MAFSKASFLLLALSLLISPLVSARHFYRPAPARYFGGGYGHGGHGGYHPPPETGEKNAVKIDDSHGDNGHYSGGHDDHHGSDHGGHGSYHHPPATEEKKEVKTDGSYEHGGHSGPHSGGHGSHYGGGHGGYHHPPEAEEKKEVKNDDSYGHAILPPSYGTGSQSEPYGGYPYPPKAGGNGRGGYNRHHPPAEEEKTN